MGFQSKETKHPRFGDLPLSTSGPEKCALTVSTYIPSPMDQALSDKSLKGTALLASPYHNKGSAFSSNERRDFKLYGLLPPNVQTLQQQVDRAYQQYSSRPNDLAKNTFMTSMKEQNEVLYYGVSFLHPLTLNQACIKL